MPYPPHLNGPQTSKDDAVTKPRFEEREDSDALTTGALFHAEPNVPSPEQRIPIKTASCALAEF